MADDDLTARQLQTLPGRRAFTERFSNSEEKSEYFSAIGKRGAEGRLILSSDERAALLSAYSLLATLVEKSEAKKKKAGTAS
jgi:hypothetical protein